MVKHIGCFSGGKDSTALMLWMRENIGIPGKDWTPVFCDTGWEHPITYAYVEEINATVLNGSLVTLQSEKFDMRSLVRIKGMIPHPSRRICTSELKIYPLHKFYQSLDDGEIFSYQGVRADESASRACLREREDVDDVGGYTVVRPLLKWSAEDCFSLMAKHGIKPNPLYLLGAGRVGCFPCISINLRELKTLLATVPEVRDRISELEQLSGQTFFKPGFIPERFCTRDTEGRMFPTAEDVFRYIESVDEDQLPLLPTRSCMSVYNLCE